MNIRRRRNLPAHTLRRVFGKVVYEEREMDNHISMIKAALSAMPIFVAEVDTTGLYGGSDDDPTPGVGGGSLQ